MVPACKDMRFGPVAVVENQERYLVSRVTFTNPAQSRWKSCLDVRYRSDSSAPAVMGKSM